MASRRRIAWTLEAERTLLEVLEYTGRDSPAGARDLLRHALAASRSLSTLAERGRVVPEYGDPAVREIFVHRHRLMYRVSGDAVHILAFIHGARDFERWRSGE